MRLFLSFLFATLLPFAATAQTAEEESTPNASESSVSSAGADSADRAQRISEHARASVVDGTFDVEVFTARLGQDGIRVDEQSLPIVLRALRGLALQPGTEVEVYERFADAREAAGSAFERGELDLPGMIDRPVNELVEGGLLTRAEAADLLAQVGATAAAPPEGAHHVVARDAEGNWIASEGSILLFSGQEPTLELLFGDASENIQVVSPSELEVLVLEEGTLADQLADRREAANRRIVELEKREEIPTHGSLGQTITSWMFLDGHEELNGGDTVGR